MLRQFNHIAKAIKDARKNCTVNYSQSELSKLCGYKNGKFISNIERGISNLPRNKVAIVCMALHCPPINILNAMTKDYDDHGRRIYAATCGQEDYEAHSQYDPEKVKARCPCCDSFDIKLLVDGRIGFDLLMIDGKVTIGDEAFSHTHDKDRWLECDNCNTDTLNPNSVAADSHERNIIMRAWDKEHGLV